MTGDLNVSSIKSSVVESRIKWLNNQVSFSRIKEIVIERTLDLKFSTNLIKMLIAQQQWYHLQTRPKRHLDGSDKENASTE